MIKKGCIRRIIIASFALVLVILTIYLFPQNDVKIKTETVHQKSVFHNIYLIDPNNYVAMVKINVESRSKEEMIKEIIESLTNESHKSMYTPDGFVSPINESATIKNIEIEDGTLIIDFSSSPFHDNGKYEEKTIEAIVYSVTEIDGIDKVVIKVNGEIIDKLPYSGKFINNPLTRKIGINRKSRFNDISDTKDVTTFFINYYDNNPYYIPVTLTTDSDKNKIEILIEELSGKDVIDPNLKTYLEAGTILKNYQITDNEVSVDFNSAILNGFGKLSEEVIYGLSISIKENYSAKEVNYYVNDKKISSYTFKTT